VLDRIRAAAASFAVDVLAYAVMSNHLHIVVSTEPSRVTTWTAREVAQRWAIAHPRTGADGAPVPWSDAAIAAKANDGAWVTKARLRLRSLSWFMTMATQHGASKDAGTHLEMRCLSSIPQHSIPIFCQCLNYFFDKPFKGLPRSRFYL